MIIIEKETMAEAWEESMKQLLLHGRWTFKRTGGDRILDDAAFIIIRNPCKDRLSKHCSGGLAENYTAQLLLGAEPHEKFYKSKFTYDYHERLYHYDGEFDQVDALIKRILAERWTNRAVAITYRPREDDQIEHTPCLMMFQAIPREKSLDFYTVFRSHDAFRGAPYNFYGLSYLFDKITQATGFTVGHYINFSTSYHIYARDMPDVRQLPLAGECIFRRTELMFVG